MIKDRRLTVVLYLAQLFYDFHSSLRSFRESNRREEVGMLPPPPGLRGTADVPYLANLVVKPALRRRGVGAKLVACVEDLVKSWGSDCLMIKVERQNLDARRLYERLGYKFVSTQMTRPNPDACGEQTDLIFLCKDNLLELAGDDFESDEVFHMR